MRRTSRSRWLSLLCAALLVAGCGGNDDPDVAFDDAPEETDISDAEEAVDASMMPDVVGLPVDDAVAQLEELGFRVTTGVVRTTEMEPDLVYRSEPGPGRQIQEGQRVTLRVAAEPRG